MNTVDIIQNIKTFHATPANIQNSEIRNALLSVVPMKVEVDLTPADIVAMFATPVDVVEAQGAGTVIEFLSAVIVYKFGVAAYTAGGVVTIGNDGGAAVSTNVAAANSFAAAGDKVFSMKPLNADGGYTMPVNTGLTISNATEAFVNAGTAEGTAKLIVTYKVHETGL